MTTMFPHSDDAERPRRAFSAAEVVSQLAQLSGWTLAGDGAAVQISKTFTFANYFETLAFVNAVAFIAHARDHHPVLTVHYGSCTVGWNTHDLGGISAADIDCARRVDALLSAP